MESNKDMCTIRAQIAYIEQLKRNDSLAEHMYESITRVNDGLLKQKKDPLDIWLLWCVWNNQVALKNE